MARRRRHRRNLVSALLFVGAASAALAAGGPDALVPFSDVAGAATTIGVGFVIDFGGTGSTVTGCVQVPPTDSGYEALQAFVAQEDLAAPQFEPNGSGLLCSINGIPAAPACGEAITGGYQFWSYWYMTDGSGNWTYANRGASAEVGSATNGEDVEGWRFQNPGPDNASAPEPSPSPDYARLCASVAPSPTTTAPVPAPATTTPGTVTTPTSTRTGAGSSTATAPGLTPGGSVATATVGPRSTTATSPTSSTTAPAGHTSSTHTTSSTAPGPESQSLGAADTADHEGSGGGAVPTVVGALLVLALAAGAVFGWRRRARSE